LVEEIKENKDSIVNVSKGIGQEYIVKALTNRASITNDSQSLRLPDIGQLGVKERNLYNIFPKFPVSKGNHKGTITYIDWDEATTVRAAAMVAEGAAFPESTAKFEEYNIPLKKVGDTLPVTEEFFEDEVAAAAELEMFLNTNVETVIDNQIAVGDGTGQNLLGLVASVPAYTAVASGIPSANIYDLVTKVRTDIVSGRGSKYAPNFVAMTSVTADRLRLEKDANDNYIFRNDTGIGSMIIIEDNNMADNTLVVGDSRFGRIYEMGGVVLTKGEINAQFTSDMITLKARKRLLFLIRTVDKTGFRKVTNVTTALATLAS
jgi:HK97 family phage major capsid protein